MIRVAVLGAAGRMGRLACKAVSADPDLTLVAAVSAVDEHSKSTLEGLVKDNGKTLFEADGESRTQDEGEIIPDPDVDPLTH